MIKYSKSLETLALFISPSVESQRIEQIILSEQIEWTEIIAFANQHLLVPTLYSALKDKECFDLLKDNLLQEYLETVYHYNEARNQAILKQLQSIANLLSKIEVTPVLLKGASALSEGYYKHIGARVMSDIDILVPEEKLTECVQRLESKGGYQPINKTHKLFSTHHWRRMYSKEGVSGLELHFKSLSSVSYPYFTNEVLHQHLQKSKQIHNAMVIEPTFDLYHVFLHSEISDYSHKHKALALRQLHHGAMIINSLNKKIKWEALDKMARDHSILQEWRDYLSMQHTLFSVDIPSQFLGNTTHLDIILSTIDKEYNNKVSSIDFIREYIQEIFSYNALQKKYGFKSRLGFPLALAQSMGKGFFKFLFVPKIRRNLLNYLKKRKKLKKYGHHY